MKASWSGYLWKMKKPTTLQTQLLDKESDLEDLYYSTCMAYPLSSHESEGVKSAIFILSG